MTRAESVATSPFLDMRPRDQTRLADAFLRCSSCSGLAADAMETSCCRVVFCDACARHRCRRSCPTCQSASCELRPSHLARRLVDSQPWGIVGDAVQPGEAEERPSGGRECPECGRKFSAPATSSSLEEDVFLDHLMSEHGEQLANGAAWMFESLLRRGSSMMKSRLGRGHRSKIRTWDPSFTFIEDTGKSYCLGPLNGPPCECCDRVCGPRNGCNCVDCMRKDLATFGINEPSDRALVNREGVISRMSAHTGQFYCGRQNMRHDPETDGFCGPNDGNNCWACRQLDRQACNRYASILIDWDPENSP